MGNLGSTSPGSAVRRDFNGAGGELAPTCRDIFFRLGEASAPSLFPQDDRSAVQERSAAKNTHKPLTPAPLRYCIGIASTPP